MRVMMSFGADSVGGQGNPYTDLLIAAVSPEVEVDLFTWRSALFGRYDVFHVHWPEHLVSGTGIRGIRNVLLLHALALRWRMRRTRVVRTIHNDTPHSNLVLGAGPALREVDRATSAWIAMNRTSTVLAQENSVHIPHGHYRERVPDELFARTRKPQSDGTLVHLLYFGTIHRYKGVPQLLSATKHAEELFHLRVVGRNDRNGLSNEEVQDANLNARVKLDFRQVDEQELFEIIIASDAVVLPYMKLENSGALLMALSLNRPVIVPSTSTTRELQKEFGEQWVLTYDGMLNGEKLDALVRIVAGLDNDGEVDMLGRDWLDIGRRIVSVYSISTRPGRRPWRQFGRT